MKVSKGSPHFAPPSPKLRRPSKASEGQGSSEVESGSEEADLATAEKAKELEEVSNPKDPSTPPAEVAEEESVVEPIKPGNPDEENSSKS